MDGKLFLHLYNFGQKNKDLHKVFYFITKVSVIIFPIFYALFIIYLIAFKREYILFAVVVPVSALLIVDTLRKLINRKRPYITFNIDLPFEMKEKSSMPSKHSVSSLVIALTIFTVFKPFGIVLILFALLTGLSRIVVGLHYPLDVLFGFLVSIIIYLSGYFFILNYSGFQVK